MVKTIQYVKDFLESPNLSDVYAKKFIDGANGNEAMLEEFLFAEKAKRTTTVAIREVK